MPPPIFGSFGTSLVRAVMIDEATPATISTQAEDREPVLLHAVNLVTRNSLSNGRNANGIGRDASQSRP